MHVIDAPSHGEYQSSGATGTEVTTATAAALDSTGVSTGAATVAATELIPVAPTHKQQYRMPVRPNACCMIAQTSVACINLFKHSRTCLIHQYHTRMHTYPPYFEETSVRRASDQEACAIETTWMRSCQYPQDIQHQQTHA